MKLLKHYIKEWILPVLAAIVLAILINKLIFFQITVPSSSMYPTIKIGDKITVTIVHNKEKLKTGDLIVFKSDELKLTLIKRLIGLPGDEVIIKNKGQVYINGSKLEEPYVVYMEDLDKKIKIPKDKYLFLGDNRADSFDARRWKNPYIDSSDIIGKAQFVVYPFKRFGKFVIGNDALNH
ncbi:signal peptidase I [Clostridium sp.]|uniref:signal peptidase I n=1 Tax=Clostridium sp. TaxID=1506 RepID=UPI003D6D8486